MKMKFLNKVIAVFVLLTANFIQPTRIDYINNESKRFILTMNYVNNADCSCLQNGGNITVYPGMRTHLETNDIPRVQYGEGNVTIFVTDMCSGVKTTYTMDEIAGGGYDQVNIKTINPQGQQVTVSSGSKSSKWKEIDLKDDGIPKITNER